MADFADVHVSVWEAPASLKQCIEVILRKELKQSYCEILESLPAVFAKLFWNFHPSLSGCGALAGNRQYITGLSIYYWDMTCFDGLYLKKSRSPCSVLGQNIDISFGHNWSTAPRADGPLCAPHRALIRTVLRSGKPALPCKSTSARDDYVSKWIGSLILGVCGWVVRDMMLKQQCKGLLCYKNSCRQ